MARSNTVLKTMIGKGPDVLDAARFSPHSRKRLSGPGLRTFLTIADLWGWTSSSGSWCWVCLPDQPITIG